MLIFGAVSFGLYSVALVELGRALFGCDARGGNSAFAMMFGIGGLVGPSGTGAVMDAIGPNGLPLSLGLMGLHWRRLRLFGGNAQLGWAELIS